MIPLTSTKRTTTSYFKTQEKTTTEDVVFRDALLFVCHSKAVNGKIDQTATSFLNHQA
jgi:hypothetical protein